MRWIKFSHDDKFVVGVGLDNVLVIWSMDDFSVVYNRVFEWAIEIGKFYY